MKVFLSILAGILVIGALIGIGFGTGYLNVAYKNTVGVADASADTNVFYQNKSYVDGMASDLSKYKAELRTERDSDAQQAIIGLINEKYANFNINKLRNVDLKEFLQDIRDGNYDNYIPSEGK